jgi:serine/threonine-protein kinase
MSLTAGTRLGSYEILGALGAGGMGEVYRATDTKLKREVAIKVLPEAFARDEERMKRFEREAQVLASLNHPNVASIYGVEEANGMRALVLELVEGPTLAERIASGRIPLDEALRIASQIVHGLEAAHERAVIHRDLKPANVKLTKDGDVKILDFGLAKALEVDPLPVEESNSPTLTRATQVGVLLGTAAYMSPEQAKGKPADRRADMWSFGVVLYEMLTGRRAFDGDDVSETLAQVLMKEPDWTALPPGLPSRVRELLARCLTKDPKQRLQAIGEARIALQARNEKEPKHGISVWPAVTAAAAALALGVALGAFWPRPPPAPVLPLRLSGELGVDVTLSPDMESRTVDLSPDGTLLAFVAWKSMNAPTQLYVRHLEELRATPLAGTEGARNPFFSPDGQWIGFFAEGKLKKVAVSGGAAVTLGDAPNDRGGSWAEDGTIVFLPSNAAGTGLSRIASAGGTLEVLTKPDGDGTHRWPQALPGGKGILHTSTNTPDYEEATLAVYLLPSGPEKTVLRGGYHGRYLPSGHLVYIREGTLFAVPFDLDRLEVTGSPVPAVEGVATSLFTAGAQFAFSNQGTLVYVPRESALEYTIEWMDRAGRREPLRDVPESYSNPRFSPDGRRLAVDVRDDVWVYEWGRGTLTRLTLGSGKNTRPVWTPDGKHITFASEGSLFWRHADGTGETERLTRSEKRQNPGAWHPSGKFLAFTELGNDTDIMILPMEGSEASGWKPGTPEVFVHTPFVQTSPEFSPDGRWLAYMSSESGRFEVYVRPYPGPGGASQVSSDGGIFPAWSRTRRELFYQALEGRIMVAPYTVAGDELVPDKPRVWSEARFAKGLPRTRPFDLYPDGERFAVIQSPQAAETEQSKVVFILNFFDYLRRIAPVGNSK